jgi:putative DNA primase/helicase
VDGAAYRTIPDDEIAAEISRFTAKEFDRDFAEQLALWKASGYAKDLKPKKATGSRSLDGAVLDAVRAGVIVPAGLEAPVWLDTVGQAVAAAAYLPTTAGLLRLDHWLEGRLTLDLLSPRLFATHAIPFDPDAGQPAAFLNMLRAQWADDLDSIRLIREYLGYLLSGRNDLHKLLYIYGPPRSGKGALLRILHLIFGHRCVGLNSSAFFRPFGLWSAIGASVVTIGDVRLGTEPEAAELLLSIVGGDEVTIDRKYRSPWTGVMSARFVLASNELALPKDASGVTATRILAVQTNESFLGREDRELESRIAAEISAIVKWGLEGYRHLVARGQFVQPESIRNDLDDLAYSISPISEFADDLCEFKSDLRCRRDDLYRLWVNWCQTNGRKDPGTVSNFTRMLRARFPKVGTSRPRTDGDREKWLIGVGSRGR